MKLLVFFVLVAGSFVAFLNSPYTIIRKDDLAALTAKADATPAPVVDPDPPQGAVINTVAASTPSGAWMWANPQPNPLEQPATQANYQANGAVNYSQPVAGSYYYYGSNGQAATQQITPPPIYRSVIVAPTPIPRRPVPSTVPVPQQYNAP